MRHLRAWTGQFLYYDAVYDHHRSKARLAVLISTVIAAASCSPQPTPWNVLLVTIDTTRADRIGCYGQPDAHTPTLDSLAANGFLFERCYSTNPITTPSHSSIMTGTYPMLHGVRDNGLFTLPDERTTLAEVFRAHGWATAAAVGSYPLTRRFGLDQGFDFFDDKIEMPYEDFRGDRIVTRQKLFFDERPAGDVNRAILPWLRANANDPFFVWVHYFDPHQPLQPPAPYDQLFANDLYQGEIAYTDESLGRLVETLEEAGVADRTLIVVMADHGEGKEDHDELTHSLLCFNSTIRVPLIMRVPGARGGTRVVDPVGSVDVAPTILDLVGLPAPEETQGMSLRPFFHAGESPPDLIVRPHYAETLSPQLSYGWSEVRAIINGRYKYIHTSKPELFDLETDPAELKNLAADQPELAASLKHGLEEFVASKASSTAVAAAGEVDQETLNRLAALGYITAGEAPPPRTTEEIRDGGVAPQDRAGDVSRWSAAKNLMFDGKFIEARELAETLVDLDPENRFYLTLLARAQLALGQVDEALSTMERAPSLDPQAADIYLGLARALAARGDLDRGLRIAERIAGQYPSTHAYTTMAYLYRESGNREAFRTTLEDAIEFDPSHAAARVTLAADTAKSGDLITAEAELRRALTDGPLYAPAHFNLGMVLLGSDRPEEALESFRRSAELQPKYWNASLGEIAACVALGRTGDAKLVRDLMVERGAPADLVNQADGLLDGS